MVVVRVVADVAGDVGLLQPADAVLEPRRARDRPRTGQRLRVALVRPERRRRRWRCRRRSRAGPRATGSSTARSRWPGTRPTGTITGVMYLSASRQASIAKSKHSPGVAGATIGIGESPLRPNITCSRSACSVLVGMPVDGPARWTSMTTSGSSTMTARPIASDLSAMPGPDVAVSADRAAVRRADGRADRGDLVLGLEGLDAELLVARQLVEDVRGRRDRVAPVEQRPVGQPRGGHEAERGRLVAGDVAVRARVELGRRHAVVRVEHLGRLAEGVAGLERPLVRLGDDRPGRELLVDPVDRRLAWSRSYSQNIRPRAKKFLVRSFCLLVMSSPSSERSLSVEIGTSKTV